MIRRYLARRRLRQYNDIAKPLGLQVTDVETVWLAPRWKRFWSWLRGPHIQAMGNDERGIYVDRGWPIARRYRWDEADEIWRRDAS